MATYLDAGHSKWLPQEEVIKRLEFFGVKDLQGFSLNVSNTRPLADVTASGEAVAIATDSHYVIDTSRNGGSSVEYCNPANALLGAQPAVFTVDAWMHACG